MTVGWTSSLLPDMTGSVNTDNAAGGTDDTNHDQRECIDKERVAME